jgi:hypothetical protein
MKVLITESKMKDIIKSNFGIDLTDKIHMVTNKWELPFEFDKFINDRILNNYLNKYGPMYVFDTPSEKFLAQDRGEINGGWYIVDTTDEWYSELEILQLLGLQYLGMSLGDLINLYMEES